MEVTIAAHRLEAILASAGMARSQIKEVRNELQDLSLTALDQATICHAELLAARLTQTLKHINEILNIAHI